MKTGEVSSMCTSAFWPFFSPFTSREADHTLMVIDDNVCFTPITLRNCNFTVCLLAHLGFRFVSSESIL